MAYLSVGGLETTFIIKHDNYKIFETVLLCSPYWSLTLGTPALVLTVLGFQMYVILHVPLYPVKFYN